jgi:hypothetical protein
MDKSTQHASDIRRAIVERGYAVVEGLVSEADVSDLRDFWLAAFSGSTTRGPIIWTPYLGEPNRTMFHTSEYGHFYRSYDFLWNSPLHEKTRALALHLNRIRNGVVETDANYGEVFTEDRYGIYVTTSYYPPMNGELPEHRDIIEGRRHWHYVLPLTFKGSDFFSGGLFLKDRSNREVDMESGLKPGSVIFYDGSLPHRVDRIESGPNVKSGRLQMFAIPVNFVLPHESERLSEQLSLRKYLKDRLRPLKRRLLG